ncbi:putative spc97 spc98 family protein [Erysiphe neolycopersici]|uniref:Spindle pole body component n=1 Tax=Erysiphe neolycopersici TaxID=212602 RepID=A0A420HP89_9PEZI|nr:putative spc97 spc98 family protein [Erysiphe neolycopersici]
MNSSIFSSSLLSVGLGRNSLLFTWNEEKHTFTQAVPKLRISGFTGETLAGLTQIFIECGNIVRSLQRYAERCYSKETSPTRIALANSVNILLETLELQLGNSSSKQNSILRLKALFEPAHSILNYFQKLTNNTAANRSDESLLSTIFEDIQILEHRTDSLRNILLQILDMVSKPWLKLASEWIGLLPETSLPMFPNSRKKCLNRLESRPWNNAQGPQKIQPDYILDVDRIPSFFAPDDARTLFEVGKSLRLLRSYHPEHPLVKAEFTKAINPPILSWNFSCNDIMQVEGKALLYEENIKEIIRESSQGPQKAEISLCKEHHLGGDVSSLGLFEKLIKDLQADVLSSNSLINQSFSYKGTRNDLSMYLHKYLTTNEELEDLENCDFSPPISLIAALSFKPIIAAQARVVNRDCIKILFSSHQLRFHLSLQKDFHLFGNGVFTSRLTHAIFDPKLGNSQSSDVLGLRLGDNSNWPLASTELQLTLMRILTECYFDSQFPGKNCSTENRVGKSLPGGLSFAIRDKSQEEIVRCINSEGLEAFDFLRISYQPPPPLNEVITPLILYKYDELFKFLLRLNRMYYSVSVLQHNNLAWSHRRQEIDQNTKRFCIEAHHFVSCVSEYFFNTGINATWRIFDAKLNQIETHIYNNEDIDVGQNEGLDKFRDYHERVVDRIMFVLLLKKRQRPVLDLLEDIFRLILEFSKLFRDGCQGRTKNEFKGRVSGIYATFSKKIEVFMAVLRGLSEKKGYGEKRSLENKDQPYRIMFAGDDLVEENTVIQLLTRLELSGYYQKPVKG